MTITIKKDSHKNKKNFQIDHQEALKILGPDFKIPRNEKLPVFETRSKYAIIGGGFGGIASALKILKTLQSEDFVIFDKYSEFGGTWLVNTYPGAASDIPSIWYSFHEEMNSNWSSPQPPQYEIEEYILSVVEKYKLRKHARFSTIISQCKWDDVSQTWEISATNLKTGQKVVHYSQYILNCIGGLALVNHFNAPGLSDFKGEYMHTAIWNSDVSLKDKDVVVVGNGCSATQLIPYLARDYDVKSVTQVVRSKHYIMPPIPSFIQPLYELFASTWLGLFLVRMLVIFLGEIRWPLFKGEGWLAQKVRANTLKESLDYMNKECPEEYKDAVIPTFKIGCKRLVVDHDYLETLHNPIVDLKSSLIKEVKSNSVVLEDGSEIHADVIIACTGYSVTRTMASIEFIGRDDMKVSDLWGKEGISAYNTTLVKNCPNLFLIGGPNHATGHSSVLMAIQNCTNYVTKVIKRAETQNFGSISVKPSKYDEWLKTTQLELTKTVFGSKFGGCSSWYVSDNHNAVNFPYSQPYYWYITAFPDYNALQFFKKVDKKRV